MHGFVKKGLLLAVASGALVLGGTGAASADTATATGATTNNEGLVAGNVAQVSGDNPVNVCGDAGAVVSARDGATANNCTNIANAAAIAGASTDSGGAVSGNVIGAALDAPVNACGVAVQALGTTSGTTGNICTNTGTTATVAGSATNDAGLLSGNVLQLSENAPINVCGDAVGVGAFDSGATGNTCSNS